MERATNSWAPPAQIGRLRNSAFAVGALAVVISVIGAVADSQRFFQSYLVAYLWVLAAPLGALGLMMLHHVTRGAWGVATRRILEAASRTLPFMAILLVPVLFRMQDIYIWSDPDVVAGDSLIQAKTPWLNVNFFMIRAAIYFAAWIALSLLLNRMSRMQDAASEGLTNARKMQALSAPGLVLFVVTVSFASFDWLMSLDPHWFSSIYGIYYMIGAALTALCFSVVISLWLSGRQPMNDVLRPMHFHDLGKLMLAFLMLWAYFSVSQLIIIWSGNLPEEVPWYIERTTGMWKWFAHAIILVHFALPFALLLSSNLKADARRLVAVAVLVLAMRWVDMYWQAAPSMHLHHLHWMDLVLPIALGGIWVGLFLRELQGRALIPRNEPFLEEALHHHG
jgi:hypothetical protein